MRSQWCREHIDEVAQNCDLGERTVEQVKQAAAFCAEHRNFSPLPTASILVLIREKEPVVKEKAMLTVQKSLESGSHPLTGKKGQKITASDVKKICDEINDELLQEELKKHPEIKTPSAETVSKIAHVPEEAVVPLKEKNEFKPATCDDCMKWPSCAVEPGDPDCKHQAGLVDDTTPDTRVKDATVTVKTPPNVSGIDPVFPEREDFVLKRGLQTEVANRIKEGFAKTRIDAYEKAIEFWVNNIRDYSIGGEE